jgi:plasmid stability protein
MATLQIRDLDSVLYRRLLERAKQDHRSLAQQAAVILERALLENEGAKERRRELLARIASETSTPWPDGLPSPADLIREDRDR